MYKSITSSSKPKWSSVYAVKTINDNEEASLVSEPSTTATRTRDVTRQQILPPSRDKIFFFPYVCLEKAYFIAQYVSVSKLVEVL